MQTIHLENDVFLNIDLEHSAPGTSDGAVELQISGSSMKVPFTVVSEESVKLDAHSVKSAIETQLNNSGYELTVKRCFLPV